MLALVVASRFGMLLGLALWLGLATAVLVGLPVLDRELPDDRAPTLTARLVARVNLVLIAPAALVLMGLASRVLIDRAAPPSSIVLPVALMTLARLVALAIRSPAIRRLMITLEVCGGLYALYAVS